MLIGRALEEVDVHDHAQADADHVGLDEVAIGGGHAGHDAIARVDLGHLDVVAHLHAGRRGNVVDERAAVLVEHAAQEARTADQPDDLQPVVAVGLGQLVGDVAPADHDRASGVLHVIADGGRIVPVLEVEDAAHVGRGAGHGQRVWPPTGGDQQAVVRKPAAVGGGGDALVDVERFDLGFGEEGDAALRVLLRRTQEDLLAFRLVAQERRQGDAVVERVGFVGEEGDLAQLVRFADGFRGVRAGRPVADDQIAFAGRGCQTVGLSGGFTVSLAERLADPAKSFG